MEKPAEPQVSAESSEKLRELAMVPVFRNNDLYAKLFPEVTPTFEQGTEPTVQGIFNEVMKHKNMKIILDNTCYYFLSNLREGEVKLEDFPEEMGIEKVPMRDGVRFDLWGLFAQLEEKFGISLAINKRISESSGEPWPDTVDGKIQEALYEGASFPDIADNILDIAKRKNPNAKRIVIATNKIADHVGIDPKEDKRLIAGEVIKTLTENVQKHFGVEPVLVASIQPGEVGADDHVIIDRHNLPRISREQYKQFSVLPLETELQYSEELGFGMSGTLVKKLRKEFEVQ